MLVVLLLGVLLWAGSLFVAVLDHNELNLSRSRVLLWASVFLDSRVLLRACMLLGSNESLRS